MRVKVIKSDKGSRTVYPVNIITEKEEMPVSSLSKLEDGRIFSEEIAKVLKLDIQDFTGLKEKTRPWQDLDLSIRELAKKYSETYEPGEMPNTLKGSIVVDEYSENITIKLKKGSISKVFVILFFVMTFAQLGIVAVFFLISSFPIWISLPVIGFILIGNIVSGTILSNKFGGAACEIIATKDSLSIKKGILKADYKADEIEELDYIVFSEDNQQMPTFLRSLIKYRGGIAVRSDKQAMIFGSQLEKDEMEWIFLKLKKLLTD